MNDRDWEMLLTRIRARKCTPFLGAGACAGTLPLGGDIARAWAGEDGYPLDDSEDLTRVAQFLGVLHEDAMWPKDKIRDELLGIGPPDFSRPDEPHAVLAGLPLPVYLTSNYDDFMVRALEYRRRSPLMDFCRWNTRVADDPGHLKDEALVPSVEAPVVFHLHGHLGEAASIVLTEDSLISEPLQIRSATARCPPCSKACRSRGLESPGRREASRAAGRNYTTRNRAPARDNGFRPSWNGRWSTL